MSEPTKYPHVVRAVFERPWAIVPSTLSLIVDLVRFRAEGGVLSEDDVRERIGAASNGPRSGGRKTGTVAVLPLYGVISGRQNLMSATSGGTSVEGFTRDFRECLADETIDGIVIDIDSPGGTVDGVEELAAEIRAARGQKPIVAVANSLAASAAYWIACAADELVVTPSGAVGSIGVFAAHQDLSAAAEMEGVRTTLISAGKFKTEGNQWEPLTAEGRAAIQDRVDAYYGMFVDAVANGRGVKAADVRTGFGQGRTVLAKTALASGMVDRIGTLDATIRRVAAGKVKMRLADGARAGAARVVLISREDLEDAPYLAAAGTRVRAMLEAEILAGPIAVHHGTTDSDAFDGPGEEAKIPNSSTAPTLERMYAWRDEAANPDTKAAYRFIHHFWRGIPGPASTRACSAGIGVLNGARGGTTIPDADRRGVWDHLAAHLRDAGMEPPALALLATAAGQMCPDCGDPANCDCTTCSCTDPSHSQAAAATGLPSADGIEAVAAEAEQRVTEATRHASIRARDGRRLSATDRDRLAAARASIDALLTEAERPRAEEARRRLRMRAEVELAEAASRGYRIPQRKELHQP